MNTKLITWLLLYLFFTPLFSQNKELVDSLLKESKGTIGLKKTLSNIDEALKIAKSINYEEGVLRAELSKIGIYLAQEDVDKGVKQIEKVEPDVLKSNNNDLIAQFRITKAYMYLRLNLKSAAETELKSAMLYSDKILNDDLRHSVKGRIYLEFAGLYFDGKKKNNDLVFLGYLKKAYRESSLVKDESYFEDLIVICDVLGGYYSETKDFTSAKFYFKKSLTISKKVNCIRCQIYSFNMIGAMYNRMGDYSNAIKNYEKSLKMSKLWGYTAINKLNYQGLSEVYDKLNDDKKLKETLLNLKAITDSINENDDLAIGTAVKTITSNIDSKHKKDISYLKVYIIIGSILCVLLLYITLMYLKKYRTERENNEKLEKDLTEKTFFIQSLNSSKSIIEKDEELKNVIRMAIKNDVLFFQAFNELFPDFKEKLLLLDPFFKIGDLKFCYYLKLNFDTKEIARYTGNSVRSVESKKYRLRKKLGISSQEDINAWFFNL